MPLPKERIYTTKDIYSLPEGKRAELIDGQIYHMAPPGRKHQEIIAKFSGSDHRLFAAGYLKSPTTE